MDLGVKARNVLLKASGIMTICTGLQSNMAGFTALRLLLGIVEVGIYPGCSFILTNWYTSEELQGRMSILRRCLLVHSLVFSHTASAILTTPGATVAGASSMSSQSSSPSSSVSAAS